MLIQIDEPVIHWIEPDFRLLYVGSDQDFVASLRSALPSAIYQVVPCPDRSSAILFLESDIRYHLFLLEVDAQDPLGLELIRLARSLSHREHTPIIAVTANERKGDLEEVVRREGANECMSKTRDISTAGPEAIKRCLGLGRGDKANGIMSGTASRSDTGSQPVPMAAVG